MRYVTETAFSFVLSLSLFSVFLLVQRFSSCPSCPMFSRESLGIIFSSFPSCPSFPTCYTKYWYPNILCKMLENLENLEKWCPKICCKMLEHLKNLKKWCPTILCRTLKTRKTWKTWKSLEKALNIFKTEWNNDKRLPNIITAIQHTIKRNMCSCIFA